MGDKTGISWTDATWNPVTGCTKVSAGCDHCYAESIAHRFSGTVAYPDGFAVTLRPERLDQPLRWRKPRKVFVNSMSDLFHADIPDEYIARVFAVMALAQQHQFQVLTKRHARMRTLLSTPQHWKAVGVAMSDILGAKTQIDQARALPNVWLGVSVENQHWADIRVPALLATPAAVRFLSCEPLLGPVNLTGNGGHGVHALPDLPQYDGGDSVCQDRGAERCHSGCAFVDWVIVGGESGPHARPMHPDWARSLRDQCQGAGVPFLFKQWGEWAPSGESSPTCDTGQVATRAGRGGYLDPTGSWRAVNEHDSSGAAAWADMRWYGRRHSGDQLDGVRWHQFPTR